MYSEETKTSIMNQVLESNDPEFIRLFSLIAQNMELIKDNPKLLDLVSAAIENLFQNAKE